MKVLRTFPLNIRGKCLALELDFEGGKEVLRVGDYIRIGERIETRISGIEIGLPGNVVFVRLSETNERLIRPSDLVEKLEK